MQWKSNFQSGSRVLKNMAHIVISYIDFAKNTQTLEIADLTTDVGAPKLRNTQYQPKVGSRIRDLLNISKSRAIILHPMRRQYFAGELHVHFYNF